MSKSTVKSAPKQREKAKRSTPTAALAIMKDTGACADAVAWVAAHGGTPRRIWSDCPRGDWMLWLAAKRGVDRKLVVTAVCKCARLALKHVPAGETRPLKAIEAAEAWVRGEATIEQVRAAADAADAAYAAYAADAAYAAYAAYAAAAAAYAAYAAAAAAAAYADADADADAREQAREKMWEECAVLVREVISFDLLGIGKGSKCKP
jgi:hypothetical protein